MLTAAALARRVPKRRLQLLISFVLVGAAAVLLLKYLLSE